MYIAIFGVSEGYMKKIKILIVLLVLSTSFFCFGIEKFGVSQSLKATSFPIGEWSDVSNYDTNWDGLTKYDLENEFIINNAFEFAAFGVAVSEGKTFSNKLVTIANDIDLGSHYWSFVAKDSVTIKRNCFSGTLNGQNHTVRNLNIKADNKSITNNNYQYGYGLFQYVNNGVIKDITIEDTKITISKAATGHFTGIGVIAGNMIGSTLTNVTVNNAVIETQPGFGSEQSSGWYIGGLVGLENDQKVNVNSKEYSGNQYQSCSVNFLEINYNDKLSSDIYNNPYLNMGGLVGGQYNSNAVEKNVSSTFQTNIDNCILNGIAIKKKFTGTTFSVEGFGGVMGFATLPTRITNTHVTKLHLDISAPQNNTSANFGSMIGGIIGVANKGITANDIVGNYQIEKCSVKGEIIADNKIGLKPHFIGAIAGRSLRFTLINNYTEIDFYQSNYQKSNVNVGNVAGLLGGDTTVLVKNNILNNKENDTIYRDGFKDSSEFSENGVYEDYYSGIAIDIDKNWVVNRNTPVEKDIFVEPLYFSVDNIAKTSPKLQDLYTITYTGDNVEVDANDSKKVKFTEVGKQKLHVNIVNNDSKESWDFVKYIDVFSDRNELTVQPLNMVDYIVEDNSDHFPKIVLHKPDGISMINGVYHGSDNENTIVNESGGKSITQFIIDQYAFYLQNQDGVDSLLPCNGNVMDPQKPNQTYTMKAKPGAQLQFETAAGKYELHLNNALLFTRPSQNQQTTPAINQENIPQEKVKDPLIVIPKDIIVRDSTGHVVSDLSKISLLQSAILDDFATNEQLNNFYNKLAVQMPSGYQYNATRFALVDANNGNIYCTTQKNAFLTLIIPYPEGSNSNDDFVVLHYKEGSDLRDPFDYDLENPDIYSSTSEDEHYKITKTLAGLELKVDNFSPFAIGFKKNINQYTITSSASEGGSITPNGIMQVNENESKKYTFVAKDGYKLESVRVDNEYISISETLNTYEFTNVNANHEIHVTFKKMEEKTITPSTTNKNEPSNELVATGDTTNKNLFVIALIVAALCVVFVLKKRNESL